MIKVADIMSTDVMTVSKDLTIREIAEQFAMKHVSAAPVVSRGAVIGLISSTDILDFIASLPAELGSAGLTEERNVLDEHTVEEAMTRPPLATLPPGASANQAAEMMQSRGIHRVVVMEDNKLSGIISAMDLVQGLVDGKLTKRTFVFPRGSGG